MTNRHCKTILAKGNRQAVFDQRPFLTVLKEAEAIINSQLLVDRRAVTSRYLQQNQIQ